MKQNPTQPHGNIVFEEANTNDSLNSGSDNGKLSPKKLLIFLLIALIILGGAAFGAFAFVKSHLTFGESSQEKYKNSKNYQQAPDSIGKYIPEIPKIPEDKQSEVTESEPDEPPTDSYNESQADLPLVFVPETDTQTTPEEQTPSLKERRLGAGISSYSQNNSTSQAQNPEIIPSRQVKLLDNIDYTLVKGTKIPCTIETNIISEQAGFTSCIISQDVYSANARVLLLEKGSKVTGEYRSNLKNGDRRLQIIWDRLITPYDIVVELLSPTTDRLGASGVTGKVDNRWATRIGSALLVSLIRDSLEFAGKKSHSADVIVDSNSAQTGTGIAEKILEKNIDLSPIVYIREGELINIYVAEDVDLSPVYNARSFN